MKLAETVPAYATNITAKLLMNKAVLGEISCKL
jgi:hypothetical protein